MCLIYTTNKDRGALEKINNHGLRKKKTRLDKSGYDLERKGREGGR
jgi:hypothetical protein